MLVQCSSRIISKQILGCISFRNASQVNIVRTFYNDRSVISHMVQNLRQWHVSYEEKLQLDKRKPPSEPTSRTSLIFFSTDAPEMHHFFSFYWKRWWDFKKTQYRKLFQRELYEEFQTFGPDLATAQFVLKYGGRVKFRHSNDWIEKFEKNENYNSKLPAEYDPYFVLVAVDLRGYPLEFCNLDIIFNLYELTWLSLRGCKTINDWAIDKLAGEYPMLEYLDISECINVTERGLEALYKIPNLKKLIITNFYNSPALELTCFMLEDINPNLTCEIQIPEEQLLPKE